jgi:hypothetical protein
VSSISRDKLPRWRIAARRGRPAGCARRDYAALNGFDRILDEVRQRLASCRRSQTIGTRPGGSSTKVMPGVRDLVQEQRLARDLVDVLVLNTGFGHAREVGEFVHHAPRSPTWRTMVPGQPLERLLVGRNLLPEAPLQPLGGELDRSQRVLDLVRDAAGDVGPGGAPLVGQLVGDVVEGQHRAVAVAHPLDGSVRCPRRRALRRSPRPVAAHELVEVVDKLAKAGPPLPPAR